MSVCVDVCAGLHMRVRELVFHLIYYKELPTYFFFQRCRGATVPSQRYAFDLKCTKMSLFFQSTCRYTLCSYFGVS